MWFSSCGERRIFARRGWAWKGVGERGWAWRGRGGGVAGRAGPGRPPRNSFAGLVRQNRCLRGVRSGQDVWQRFCQRCLSQSDSRGNLPGPARPATVLRYVCGRALCYLRGTYKLYSLGITMPHPCDNILCHPTTFYYVILAKAGIQALLGKGAVFRLLGVWRNGLVRAGRLETPSLAS